MPGSIKPRLLAIIGDLEQLAQDCEEVACNVVIDTAEVDVTTDEAMRWQLVLTEAFNRLDATGDAEGLYSEGEV